ncbi:MAG: hypothetical protein AAF684_06890 [Pseudomonadota bacterium]
MRRVWISIVIAIALAAGSAVAQSFEEGERAFAAGDFTRAAEIFVKLGRQGDPRAAFAVGRQFAEGLGLPQDARRAKQWYKYGLLAQADRDARAQAAAASVSTGDPSRGLADLGRFADADDARRAWIAITERDRGLAAMEPQLYRLANGVAVGLFEITRPEAERVCAAARAADLYDCRLFF